MLFAVTVPHASYEIKEHCDYVTQTPSGKGAVREVVDIVRYAIGFVPAVYNE